MEETFLGFEEKVELMQGTLAHLGLPSVLQCSAMAREYTKMSSM